MIKTNRLQQYTVQIKTLLIKLFGLTDIVIGIFLYSFMLIKFGNHLANILVMLLLGFMYIYRAKLVVTQHAEKGVMVRSNLALQLRLIISLIFQIIPSLMLINWLFHLFS